ncbi:16970_t:CDS:2 [Entrophospora sp. SA101]|nr:16970_t:CDS:2 [Entrophospora sp. SA101]
MSAIVTKIVEKYKLTPEMDISELSQYTSEFLENLTDDRKRNQARRRLRDSFKFSIDQVSILIPNQRGGRNKTINLVEGNSRIAVIKPPKSLEEEIVREITKRILQNRYGFSGNQVPQETIGDMAQRILRDKLSIRDIRAEAYALALSALNANAGNDLQYGHYFPDYYNYCKKNQTRLEKFLDIICGNKKPIYTSNLTLLKLTYYHSLSYKKIKGIVNSCPNIIHLDLDYTAGFGYKALIMVAKSYPNLKYLNLRKAGLITDESLCVIAKLCNKLEYLNISNCVEITKKSLFEVARSCQNLEELYFAEGDGITDKSISYIINQCSKLRCLDIAYSGVEIEDSSMMIQKRLNIEYLDFATLMEDEPPPLIRGLIQHDDLNPPDHFITEFNNYLRQVGTPILPHFHNRGLQIMVLRSRD